MSNVQTLADRMTIPNWNVTTDIPKEYVNWLFAKGLTEQEIKDNYVYNAATDRVVFYVKKEDDEFAEARTMFSNRLPKTLQYGKKPYLILGDEKKVQYPQALVIVEDLISAIKISRKFRVMPLFGSYLPAWIMSHIREDLSVRIVLLWMDNDKYNMAKNMANQLARIGLDATAIFTDKDPKAYSDKEIDFRIKSGLMVLSDKDKTKLQE